MTRSPKRATAKDGELIAQEQMDPGDPVVLDQNISDEMTEPQADAPPAAEASDPPPPQTRFAIPPAGCFVLPPLPGYARRHIECQLSGPQAETLGRLLCGLDQVGARLASGRRVITAADAFPWLLEWVAQNGRQE